MVHALAVLLSSYGCTWEVGRALEKLETYLRVLVIISDYHCFIELILNITGPVVMVMVQLTTMFVDVMFTMLVTPIMLHVYNCNSQNTRLRLDIAIMK